MMIDHAVIMNRTWLKLFLGIFLSTLLASSLLVVFFYHQETGRIETLLLEEDRRQVQLRARLIGARFQGLASDLMFLAGLFVESFSDDFREQVTRQLLSFAMHRGVYDQLRFLDHTGMEKVRVNYRNGNPSAVLLAELQNKRDRYYFREAMTLDRNEIFVSPFDLNMEGDEIERPLKPVIRIATPLFDSAGRRQGIFILNYLGRDLFARMRQVNTLNSCDHMLLNAQGYWLCGPDPSTNWGFMLPRGKAWTFGNRYPEAWQAIRAVDEGRKSLGGGYFTWNTLYPRQLIQAALPAKRGGVPAGNERQIWKIVAIRSAESLYTTYMPVRMRYLVFVVGLSLILALVAGLAAYFRIKQQRMDRQERLLQEAQSFTNKLLKSAISPKSLKEEMAWSLEMILSISWLSILSRGSIFLIDDETGELVMVVEQGLPKPLLTACARLPMGKCLCGRAAQHKKIVFTDRLDHDHEIRFAGITEHGHICVPILKEDQVLGVLNLYVEQGHIYNPQYGSLLDAIVSTLAGIIERKRMDEQLAQAHLETRAHHDKLAFERTIVEETLARIRDAEEFDGREIRYLMAPAENTAGDILLSTRRPDGVRHFLLGDFTGHGLPSALAGPAVADAFYSMSGKGRSAMEIMVEINTKLVVKLPAHLYLAACFVELDTTAGRLAIWNAGLPEQILFRGGKPIKYYKSESMPLGIIEDLPLAESERVAELQPGERLYLFTDGVIEACDAHGTLFGRQRFETLLTRIITENQSLDRVLETLNAYQAGDGQADDITLLEITVADPRS